ncbi:arsenate reductase (glutaredoxin) [Lutibacter sp. TH_r2]|uniref:arsenate reductase (glutaredoxin) n=1 Tax=Lutibacter sp. TH_r2 TaxID=3082083 RepID=UPI002955AFE7|nr:arsenate reductase (glutaredoxin) [Lutibacter sp. TH_r2]MDV7188396.1 arsenate reductase (glutaredoxin) [Lutibacter sp. TH_r2]
MKIYHNPRCSKSRQGLAILEETNVNFETIKYLDTPISKEELTEIISLLNISPIELVRKNETIWKENFKGKVLSDKEIINAMVQNPKLIERPIVINNGKAVIGRPPELIKNIL